jgi:ABC-type branched-subunit amino acid transport system ATPase component
MSDTLELVNISKRFGPIAACDGLNLTFAPGSATAIIGPNGAGKTTSMNLIAGALLPDAGQILWRGRDIAGLPQHRIARLGIARMFQDLKVFASMTVLENLVAGRVGHRKAGADAFVHEVLDRIGLRAHADRRCRDLSYAERKLTALGRVICAEADLVMLDEPASGLDGASLATVLALIGWLRAQNRTLIVVEHNLSVVAQLATRAVLIEDGKVIADGPPQEVFGRTDFGRIYFSLAA